MVLTDHLRMTLLVDGVLQVELTNIKVNGKGGSQAVETLQGLAGRTPGSPSLTISGTWAVPITGFEFDIFTAAATGSLHELQIPVGAKSIISKGWFDDCGISQSVNQSTECEATFMGSFTAPE